MSEAEDALMEEIARRAARAVLEEFFEMLGVDASTPRARLEMQEDFRHVRLMRTMTAQLGNRTLRMITKVVIGSAVLTVCYKFGIKIPEVLMK